MLLGYATFAFASTAWVPWGAGVLVTFLVIGVAVVHGRWRRRQANATREEDLPWDDLLSLLQQYERKQAEAGLPPEKVTDEVFGQLMGRLPVVQVTRPVELAEDHEFQALGGERRAGNRRWGNPTEIHLLSPLWPDHLHGLVVNRSTGGLGIFSDREIPPGTPLRVRGADAPWYVPAIEVEVRHCRKVGKGYLFGCQFNEDVPWTARVWFG